MPDPTPKPKTRDVEEEYFIADVGGHQIKHNHLLAIAVDHYEDQPDIPHLSNCVNDIEDLIEVLTSHYFFNKENIRYLRSRHKIENEAHREAIAEKEKGYAYVGEANHENIIAQLKFLAQTITPKDNVIICFSGHGIYDKDFDEGYWIPSDGILKNNASYVENGTIRTALNAIKSHHTVLISDSCYSGTLFSTEQTRSLDVPRIYQQPSRWGITAGRKEPVSDGALGENSPFAKELLDILKQKREVWIGDLVNKIIRRVTDEKNKKQTPAGEALSFIKGHKNGQFVFMPRLATESDYWQIAWRENTRKGYYAFLSRYPDGEYEEIALAALNTFAANEKPAYNDGIIKTYDFLQEHLPDLARKYILLNVSTNRKDFKPLSKKAEEAYLFLLKHTTKETAVKYIKAFINGNSKVVLNKKVKDIYDFLLKLFPDDAVVFLKKYFHWDLVPALNKAVKETYAFLSEHLGENADIYIKLFAQRRINIPTINKTAKDTYAFFMEYLPELATPYLKLYARWKTVVPLNEAAKDTYFYLLEHLEKEAAPYIRLFIHGKTTATLNQAAKDTYDYLQEHLEKEAAPYLKLYTQEKTAAILNKAAKDTYTYFLEHKEQEAAPYLKSYTHGETTATVSIKHKDLYTILVKQFPAAADTYLKAFVKKEGSFDKASLELIMNTYDYLSKHKKEMAKTYLEVHFSNKIMDNLSQEMMEAYHLIKEQSPEEAIPFIKDFTLDYVNQCNFMDRLDAYTILRAHLPETAAIYMDYFFKRNNDEILKEPILYLFDHLPEAVETVLRVSCWEGKDLKLTDEHKAVIKSCSDFLKKFPGKESVSKIKEQIASISKGEKPLPLS